MNKKIILFFLIFSSFTYSQSGKKNEKAIIKTIIHCDHCQVCETCDLKFKDNMLKIKGVKMYELDEQKMTISVYYNGKKTNLQTIKTAISKLGFDADEIKAETTAYNNLDECCKKNN